MLVFITPGFPKDEADTSCLPQIQQFMLALQTLHPASDITILSLQYPFQKKRYKWYGIEVIALGGCNSRWKKPFTLLRALKALKQIHQTTKIKMMVSFWLGEAAFIAQRFGNKNQIKRYFWLHGQDVKPGNKYVSLVHPEADQLIAISEFSSKQFEKHYGTKLFLIAENGVNPNAFPDLKINNRKYEILGVGSLIALKNYSLFIELIAEVKITHPQLKVLLVGEGPELGQLKQQQTHLGLENTIQFTGGLSYSKVLELMNDSKVFLHTSDFEGSSSVIAEALYSGCHVVSTIDLRPTSTPHLFVSQDKNKLKEELLRVLALNESAKRVLNQDLHDTAKKILALMEG